MMSKRTIIGLILGVVIISASGYSLILHIGPTVEHKENLTLEKGTSEIFKNTAPAQSPQSLIVTGDSFELELHSPGDGLQIPKTSFKNEFKQDWIHSEDGVSSIEIKNTGKSELEINVIMTQTPNPFAFTIDLMVMITGIVIIGFSMGFSMRKPKGF
jgi:hypothetical protein